MKFHNEIILTSDDEKVAENLLNGIREIIDSTRRQAMVYVNQQVSWQYYSIGKYIVENLHADTYTDYGKRIVATVSQQLQNEYGKVSRFFCY